MPSRRALGGLIAIACLQVVAADLQLDRNKNAFQASSRNPLSGVLEDVEWTPRTIAAVIITFVVSALANAGGLGGGGFLVPLFNLVLGVSLKHAMGLSQSAITGGALAAGALHIFSSHPEDSSKPLLDMNIALLFMPCLLVGVTVGVTLNELFPDWVLVVVISVLLVILSIRSLKTGLKLHRAEVAQRESKEPGSPQELLPPSNSEIPNLVQIARMRSQHRTVSLDIDMRADTRNLHQGPPPPNSLPTGTLGFDGSFKLESTPSTSEPDYKAQEPVDDWKGPDLTLPEIAPAKRREDWSSYTNREGYRVSPTESPFKNAAKDSADSDASSQQGWSTVGRQALKLGLGLLLWSVFLTLQIFKSQHYKCTKAYFGWYGAQIAFGLSCSAGAMSFYWWSHRQRPGLDVEQPLVEASGREKEGTQPSLQKVLLAAVCICLGACLCSLCGLGGGMILGPVMLDLGLHPLVAASTSLLLVGASSSTATIQFALGDRLEYGWGIIMFSICIVASLVGVAGFGKIVRKSGRASLIVFLLFFLMAGGGIMTLVFGVFNSVEAFEHGGRIGFLGLCNV